MPPSKAGSLRKALAALQWQLMDGRFPMPMSLAGTLPSAWAVSGQWRQLLRCLLKMQEILSVSIL